MFKFVAIYRQPADVAEFERRYHEEHLPLLRQVPGIVSCEVTRVTRNLSGGEGAWMIAQVAFTDSSAFKAAARTPEWAAAGENINSFAADIMTAYLAESDLAAGFGATVVA